MASHIGAPSNSKNYHNKKGAFKVSTPDTLANDVIDIIKSYTDEVSDAVMEEVESVANQGAEALKNVRQPPATKSGTTQFISTRRDWKKYSNSWAVEKKGGKGKSFINCTIHNKKHYRLTHLLEYGHATRDGNRTREFQHIEPISIECEDMIEKTIPKIIKKGGKL